VSGALNPSKVTLLFVEIIARNPESAIDLFINKSCKQCKLLELLGRNYNSSFPLASSNGAGSVSKYVQGEFEFRVDFQR
jgi:hypothetical protein